MICSRGSARSLWRARDHVISLQRFVATIEPRDDHEVAELVSALSQARRALEALALRFEEQRR